MPDRQLAAIAMGTVSGTQGVVARYSRDNGQTWGEVQLLFPMVGQFGSPEPLIDRHGELQLFFLKDVQTGLVWATKIITDPFHDIKLYHKSPLYLMRGELLDVPQKQRG